MHFVNKNVKYRKICHNIKCQIDFRKANVEKIIKKDTDFIMLMDMLFMSVFVCD